MRVTSSPLVQEAAILMTRGSEQVLVLREGLVIDACTAAQLDQIVSAAHVAQVTS